MISASSSRRLPSPLSLLPSVRPPRVAASPRRRVPASLLVALAAALPSCMVGPNYTRPAVETPPAFKSATESATEPAAHLGQDWWQLFDDPNLTKLERIAGESNLDLQAAMARIDQSRAASDVTRSQLFPTLTANPSVTRVRTPGNGPHGGSTSTVTQIPLDLSYEIDIWGRVRRSYQASKAQLQAAVYDAQVVRQTFQADVAIDYFAIRSLDAQVEITDHNIELYRKQVDLTQRQFKVGIVTQIDVLQAQTLLNSTTALGIDLRRQRADMEHALAILLGRPPADLEVAIQPLDLVPPTIPPDLPADLLRRRPDVAETEQNLIAANAQVGVATANFYPTVKLTGAAGFESINLQHALDWQSRVLSLGPSVSIPIFEGGSLTASLRQAKARYEELQANYRTAILNAYREVEDALTDIHYQSDELEVQNRALNSAREVARLAEVQYRTGQTTYLQVIDANRSLLVNELAVAQLVNQRLAATVALIKAIGGGWEVSSTTPPATAPAR